MRQKIWLILLISSLLSNSGCALFSTRHGPAITVCVSDPQAGGFDCFDQQTKTPSFVKYQDSDKFVGFPAADAQTFFGYCSEGSK